MLNNRLKSSIKWQYRLLPEKYKCIIETNWSRDNHIHNMFSDLFLQPALNSEPFFFIYNNISGSRIVFLDEGGGGRKMLFAREGAKAFLG